jgi:transcriptional regulator with PAS, ATPase and Fis domain
MQRRIYNLGLAISVVMPVDLQAKLLRALQEREVKPVGATERRQINVRIIAATNRDLESAIRGGTFRQDLYFRLNVVQVKLPPLRDRKSDIPILVTAFLEKFSDPRGPVRTISEDAMRRLIAYDWPGNVRELENAIERAVALGSGPILHVADLPSNLQYPTTERAPERDEILPLEELERQGAQIQPVERGKSNGCVHAGEKKTRGCGIAESARPAGVALPAERAPAPAGCFRTDLGFQPWRARAIPSRR